MSENENNDALIGPAKVAELYDIHAKVVSRFVKAGRIPPPVEQRHKYSRWSMKEIQQDIAAKRERARVEAAT